MASLDCVVLLELLELELKMPQRGLGDTLLGKLKCGFVWEAE